MHDPAFLKKLAAVSAARAVAPHVAVGGRPSHDEWLSRKLALLAEREALLEARKAALAARKAQQRATDAARAELERTRESGWASILEKPVPKGATRRDKPSHIKAASLQGTPHGSKGAPPLALPAPPATSTLPDDAPPAAPPPSEPPSDVPAD